MSAKARLAAQAKERAEVLAAELKELQHSMFNNGGVPSGVPSSASKRKKIKALQEELEACQKQVQTLSYIKDHGRKTPSAKKDPPRPAKEQVKKLFERYTQNDEGGITNSEELNQLVTNLVFNINLHVPNAKTTIDNKTEMAEIYEGDPWSLETFEEWFYEEFGFSEERMSECVDVTLEIIPAKGDVEEKKEKDLAFTLRSKGGASMGEDFIGNEVTMKAIAPEVETLLSDRDVVAFEKVENLCYETDEKVRIGLVRRGQLKGEICVKWHTKNVNIMEESYLDQVGTAIFANGEKTSSVELRILDNDEWNLEAMQKIHLEAIPDATYDLGELKTTTLVILNEDLFPHNCSTQKEALKMVYAFVMHLYHDLQEEAHSGMRLKVYPAIQWLLTSLMLYFALNYAVKKVEKTGEPLMDKQSSMIMLCLLCLLYIFTVGMWHFTLDKFENLKLGGKARMLLRRALMSTMIQLTSSESEIFPSGECLSIMSEQVENATSVCWTKMMDMWAQVCQLLIMTILTVVIVAQKVPTILGVPFIMMAIDLFILRQRIEEQVELFSRFMKIDNTWKAMVIEVSELRPLITAYRAGYSLECDFGDLNRASNAARFSAQKYQNNTIKILKWNHAVFICGTFLYGGLSTAGGSMSTGGFVTVISTIFSYDKVIGALFDSLFDCVNGFVSVQKIASLLNSNTRRKALLTARDRRQCILDGILKADPDFDFDPGSITMYDVLYDYKLDKQEIEGSEVPPQVNSRVGPFQMVMEQGQIICVHGTSSAGKKTFIQLLGRIRLPNVSGIVVYPDNLRVRYIPGEPLLFNQSIMENLRFGLRTTGKNPTDDEIWALCRQLGISEELIGYPDYPCGMKGQNLSLSNQIYITLARALISSVDLLLVANSLDVLGPLEAKRVVTVLRQWVVDRGMSCLEHDHPAGVSSSLLKKKTFFFCTKNKLLEDCADCIINLKPRPGT